MQYPQRLVHRRECDAAARQHHHVARVQAALAHLGHQPVGGLAAFAVAQRVFGQHPRGGEAVAPGGRVVARIGLVLARHDRQAQHRANGMRLGGVRSEAVVFARVLRGADSGIDRVDHRGRVAPRVVAGQPVAAQTFDDEALRRAEHLRLGPAEAVDALLGVAHQKHAGRIARTGADVPRQPRLQRLPLQRVGVLELVDQQVPHPRIEPLLHPAGQHRVGQHRLRGALDVVHVDPAALALQGRVLGHQHPHQPRHAVVVQPGGVLRFGLGAALHHLLRGADRLDPFQLVVKLARLAGLGEQGGADAVRVAGGGGLLQRGTGGGERLGAGAAQRAGCGVELVALRQQPIDRLGRGSARVVAVAIAIAPRRRPGRHVGPPRFPARDGPFDHAGAVGQGEFDPPLQRGGQRLVGLRAAVHRHQRIEVGMQRRIFQHHRIEAPPDAGDGLGIVLQQVVAGGQAQLLQHRQRRGAQQRGEPAVEGAHLHRPAGGKYALLQFR